MSNEKYEKGLKIRTQVLGEAYVNRSIENAAVSYTHLTLPTILLV